MKLGIFCNFSHRSVGGSELVLKQVSERLVEQFNYEVTVCSCSVQSSFIENGVKYTPCWKGISLIDQINENDHIFVYSDSFWGWDTIVENIDKVVPDVSVALVGAYHMRGDHKATAEKFKANIDRFRVICHSEGWDYQWCRDSHIPHSIIPNGVNLEEFENNIIDFRKKYKIKEKYIILNVSNWFFGKGQEILPKVCRKLSENLDDFIILQLSNTVQYSYDKVFLERTKRQSKGLNIRFLRDLPREDVVAAFKASDVFLFTSKKEVAPLVLWEARAAKIPWVSWSVGDACSHHDGLCHVYCMPDKKGYIIADDHAVSSLAMFTLRSIGERREPKHYDEVVQHDWKNIVPLYNEVFNECSVS
jgi:glycosyltransferase involved in cell wall biosynthesis